MKLTKLITDGSKDNASLVAEYLILPIDSRERHVTKILHLAYAVRQTATSSKLLSRT